VEAKRAHLLWKHLRQHVFSKKVGPSLVFPAVSIAYTQSWFDAQTHATLKSTKRERVRLHRDLYRERERSEKQANEIRLQKVWF
jgi:hypothetical protein